jgi:uroporphyrinogen-III decarboxylase
MSPLAAARDAMGANQILLGNLNPVAVLLDGTPEMVTHEVSECHRLAGDRFIVGAGCEVPAATPDENLRALCEYARVHRP